MAAVHDRILELEVLCDESADTIQITAITYYRNRGQLIESNGHSLNFTSASLSATHETELGDAAIPPPTHIRLIPTMQA